MSQLEQKFRPALVKTYPPALQDLKPRYNVKGSTQNYNLYPVKPDSNTKTSMLFTVRPSTYKTLVRRDLRIRGDLIYPVRVRLTNARPAVSNLLNSQRFCFRDRPLNRMLSEPSLMINGEKITVQLNEIFQALNMLTFNDNVSNSFMAPNNLDLTYQNYNDASGSQSTPLSDLSDASLQTQHIPDGAFVIGYTDPNGNDLTGDNHYVGDNGTQVNYVNGIPVNTAAADEGDEYDVYIKIRLNENVMISPLLYSTENGLDTEAFWGIKELQLRLSFNSEMHIIRNSTTGGTTNVEVLENVNTGKNLSNYFQNAELMYYQLDIPQDMAEALPSLNSIPLVDHQTRRANTGGTIQTIQRGGTLTINSDDLRLSSIPEKLIIMCKPPDAWFTGTSAAFHYVPLKVTIRLGNQTGMLNTFDQPALYQIVRQYIPISWQSFSGKSVSKTGSPVPTVSAPLILDFARDIPLPAGMAPGVSTNFNIQITMEIENQLIPDGANTHDPVEMVMDFVSSGFLYNQNGTSQSFFGFLTESDVLNARVSHEEQPLDPLIGGSKIGHFFHHLGHSISKIGKKAGKSLLHEGVKMGKSVARDAVKDGIEGMLV